MASWISLACGIIGLVIVGATVFAMWYMIKTPPSDPSGAASSGFSRFLHLYSWVP